MTTIKEDYVSFETAKLLKKKGFDEPCVYVYRHDRSEDIWDADKEDIACQKPTLQMAMKWLREMHNLWIDIDPLASYKWTWSIWFMNDPNFKMGESSQVISTYEEAVEEAIQYSLKNLI